MSGPNQDLKANNMDTPHHKAIYEEGLEMRKKVVGEDYVERSLKNGGSDFMRPLQQFATVSISLHSSYRITFHKMGCSLSTIFHSYLMAFGVLNATK
jgi:hypothetical protein